MKGRLVSCSTPYQILTTELLILQWADDRSVEDLKGQTRLKTQGARQAVDLSFMQDTVTTLYTGGPAACVLVK